MTSYSQTATFTTASGSSDTVSDFMRAPNSDVDVNNPIKSLGGSVYIRTTVIDKSVPSGVTAQFCDNNLCTNANIGTVYRSLAYTTSGFSLYHAPFLNMNNAPANSTAFLKVLAEDTISGYSRTLTFIAWKPALGVAQTTVSSDDVSLFPNPARDAVNVIYDQNAGVKKIAIYNLIGKMMQAYIPMDTRSAKLDLDNIPSGVYFIRLMDSQGHVVATRRFNKQ